MAPLKYHFNGLKPKQVFLVIRLLLCKDSCSLCHRTKHISREQIKERVMGFLEYISRVVRMPELGVCVGALLTQTLQVAVEI